MGGLGRAGIICFLILLVPFPAGAAPKADLWAKWLAHDPKSSTVVDHHPWQLFLTRYAKRDAQGDVQISYGRVSKDDRTTLDRYLSALATVAVTSLQRDQQLAFWVNLYNALTVQVILSNYPVDSIRDIDDSPGIFSDGPWGRKRLTIEGKALSLDDIEHRILRPIWRDPRLHYVLNCASVGCPNQLLQPFSGAHAEGTLEAAAREFINSPKGVAVIDGDLIVSQLYEWYGEDFGEDLMVHLSRYARPDLAKHLKQIRRIAGYRYDWSLNGLKSDQMPGQ
jgi:hypothetical protein